MIQYKTQTISGTDIFNHLKVCDPYFNPKLSQRVDLKLYAKKLHDLASLYSAWNLENLIGLIAVYGTPETDKLCYISNVSVDPYYKRKGIASELMILLLSDVKSKGFEKVSLEVHTSNKTAILFYQKFKFTFEKKLDNSQIMSLNLFQ